MYNTSLDYIYIFFFIYLCDEVLIAGNFADHKFSVSEASKFVDKGFAIGNKVYLSRRITVDFDKKKRTSEKISLRIRLSL